MFRQFYPIHVKKPLDLSGNKCTPVERTARSSTCMPCGYSTGQVTQKPKIWAALLMPTSKGNMRKQQTLERTFGVLVGAFLLAVATGGTRADVVIDWNVAMTDYVTPRSPAPLGPPAETRVYAMAHLAMLEATKEAQRQHHGGASPEAAAAQAAHDVLAREFADGAPAF